MPPPHGLAQAHCAMHRAAPQSRRVAEHLVCNASMPHNGLNPLQCTDLSHQAHAHPPPSDLTPQSLDLSPNTKAYPAVHRHEPQHPESPHDAQIRSTILRNPISLMHRQKCTAHRPALKAHSCTTAHTHALQQRRASQYPVTLLGRHLAYRENRSNEVPRPILQHKDTPCNARPQPITQAHPTTASSAHSVQNCKNPTCRHKCKLWTLLRKHRIITESTEMPHNAV